jgi:hypothetical protein
VTRQSAQVRICGQGPFQYWNILIMVWFSERNRLYFVQQKTCNFNFYIDSNLMISEFITEL